MVAFFVSAIDAWDVKHIWRNKEDKAFEEAIEEALRNTGEFAPQAFFGDADTVCFVPPYGSPQSIDRMIDLTPKARKDLNGYLLNYLVNDFNRRDDIWWVFGFKNGNVEFSRKMVVYDSVRVAGFNAPARRETQCFASDRIILKSSSMNEFYVTERNR
jgi:hypothetical protein